MGDLDIDLATLFEMDPTTGKRNFSVSRKWFPLRQVWELIDYSLYDSGQFKARELILLQCDRG